MAGAQGKLPHRDAAGDMDVEIAHVLHRPACLTEQPVDVCPGTLFGSIAAHKSSSLRPFEVEDHAVYELLSQAPYKRALLSLAITSTLYIPAWLWFRGFGSRSPLRTANIVTDCTS